METRSFLIPASKISDVETKLEKLNKRASKLDLEQITWTFGKAFSQTREILWQNPDYPDLAPQYVERQILVVPIDMTGPFEVKFEGWSFAAALQHLPTGDNIIRAISNEIKIPNYFRDVGSDCNHCNVSRYRKDTYILYHEVDKTFVQVGSTCIKDYLGGNCPDDIISKANFVSEIMGYMDGLENSGGSRGAWVWGLDTVLAQTSACIRDFGWLSKTKANETGNTSTASRVVDNFLPPEGTKMKFSIVTNDDSVKAIAAANWAESLSDEEVLDSDYLYNIRAIARSGMVELRTMGFATSIVSAYDRAMGLKVEKKPSKHVGELKKRSVFELTLKRHLVFTGLYNPTYSYFFEDKEGNIVVWKASASHNLVEGQTYSIKGSVKEHSEYKGVPQTFITRCEIVKQ